MGSIFPRRFIPINIKLLILGLGFLILTWILILPEGTSYTGIGFGIISAAFNIAATIVSVKMIRSYG